MKCYTNCNTLNILPRSLLNLIILRSYILSCSFYTTAPVLPQYCVITLQHNILDFRALHIFLIEIWSTTSFNTWAKINVSNTSIRYHGRYITVSCMIILVTHPHGWFPAKGRYFQKFLRKGWFFTIASLSRQLHI